MTPRAWRLASHVVLPLSIAANIGLGILCFRGRAHSPLPRLELPATGGLAAAAAGSAPSGGLSSSQTFSRWEEAKSEDPSVFAANLRSLGLPEQTAFDLVKADLDRSYAAKREALRSGSHPLVGGELARATAALNAGERETLERVFGSATVTAAMTPSASAIVAAAAAASAPTAETKSSSASAPLPPPPVIRGSYAVVQDPVVLMDTTNQPFTADQLQQIDELRQQFVQSVGGANQNPNDPAYYRQWELAREAADDRFRVLFGDQAFLSMNAQAATIQPAGGGQ